MVESKQYKPIKETKVYNNLIKLGVDSDTAEILAMNSDANADTIPDARFLPISASSLPAEIRATYNEQLMMKEFTMISKSGNDQAKLSRNEKLVTLLAVATSKFSTKVVMLDEKMIFFDKNKKIPIDGVTSENFANYLVKIFGSSTVGNKIESVLTMQDAFKFTKSLLANLHRTSDNHVEQFDDFFIFDGVAIQGNLLDSSNVSVNGYIHDVTGILPRHNVKYGRYDAVKNPKNYLKVPKLLRILTLNMSNGCEEDAFYLEKLIATSIANDLSTKSKVKSLVVISGVSGAGKSHLLRYLQKVFTADYGTSTVSINQLANEFKRAEVTKTGFILSDGDMPASTIKDEASEFLKNASGGDMITAQVKNQQKEYSDFFAGLIMILSNFSTTFTDKSEAITNRLVIFRTKIRYFARRLRSY